MNDFGSRKMEGPGLRFTGLLGPEAEAPPAPQN